jgi:lipopolysaccharide transport system ATP-binding protein
MSDIAIRVENLSKQYKIGVAQYRHDSIRDHLTEWVKSLFVRNGHFSVTSGEHPAGRGAASLAGARPDTIWALNDVSFEVKHGEAIGIIGRNGSGKSTLLKILSRITEPTKGYAYINGRVGSLLEVGTGFHRDLTGRENIYLNGAILGMKKAEIARKFDEIVDFSGVEKFIDTPVKRYSSGMYVRLAFAVAAHLDPEILIVDEVLAVGDAEFQTKCLRKMIDVANEGRTVLFVSHNAAAVKNLCHSGIMLHGGEVAFNGTAEEAVDFYLRSVEKRAQTCRSHVVDLSNAPTRRVGYRPLLQRLELFTDDDKPLDEPLKVGAALKAYIYFRLEKPTSSVDAILAFDNLFGQRVLHTHSAYQPDRPQAKWIGDHVFVCEIPSLTLVSGEYKIKLALDVDNSAADTIEDATRITIVPSDYYGSGKFPQTGLFVLKHSWQLT